MKSTLVLCVHKVQWDSGLWPQSAGHYEGGRLLRYRGLQINPQGFTSYHSNGMWQPPFSLIHFSTCWRGTLRSPGGNLGRARTSDPLYEPLVWQAEAGWLLHWVVETYHTSVNSPAPEWAGGPGWGPAEADATQSHQDLCQPGCECNTHRESLHRYQAWAASGYHWLFIGPLFSLFLTAVRTCYLFRGTGNNKTIVSISNKWWITRRLKFQCVFIGSVWPSDRLRFQLLSDILAGGGCLKVMILLNKSSKRTKDIFKVDLGLGSSQVQLCSTIEV